MKAEDYATLKERYDDVLGVIGDLCRSMIIPAPGHRFIVGDFSAIEARVLAFLAGDADKLAAFRQFDCGLGRDIYCVTAEQVLGLAEEDHGKSPERQLGRISLRLGLGYQMGADRLLATSGRPTSPTLRPSLSRTRRDGCEPGAPGTRASSHTGRSSTRRRWQRYAIPQERPFPLPQRHF